MARVGLTTDRVVALAIELIEQEGYDALSMVRLASMAGVRVPSLYKHVSGIGDLQHLLAIEGMQRRGEQLERAASPTRTSREAVHALGQAYRTFAQQHPGLDEATMRSPTPDEPRLRVAMEPTLTTVFTVLDRCGVPEEARIAAARFVHASLRGFVDLERRETLRLGGSVETSFTFLLDGLHAGLTASSARATPAPHPSGLSGPTHRRAPGGPSSR